MVRTALVLLFSSLPLPALACGMRMAPELVDTQVLELLSEIDEAEAAPALEIEVVAVKVPETTIHRNPQPPELSEPDRDDEPHS